MKFLFFFLLLFIAQNASPANAEPNFHTVGWVNTFLPGGGELLLGNYGQAGLEAGLEISTFYLGYSGSKRSPLTLDGVPEDLPAPLSSLTYKKVKQKVCVYNAKQKKIICTIVDSTTSSSALDLSEVDISKSIYDDWLQEFGLKYHMVNVFNSYRKAAGPNASIGTQKIDQTSTSELFLAPFKWDNISSLWVWPAIVASGAALLYDYNASIHEGQLATISPLNRKSQRLYDATYLGVFPTGSAAPEEMFYRGFLQYELYNVVESPFFSVALSSTAYAFSHSSTDRLSAALMGAYLGWMTHANHGQLSKGIAYHFWADLLAGLYQISVVRKESGKVPLFNINLEF